MEHPFYAVNHLGGHVSVDTLEHGPLPSCVALLVSGGHTHLLHVEDLGKPIVELGTTVDDAAGEAFDKVARLLGLGFPGGPALDAAAQEGDPSAIAFPRGMTGPRDSRHDFSFSGLKTSVARYVESKERAGETFSIPDIAASFQEAVADVLTMKAVRAAKDVGVDTLSPAAAPRPIRVSAHSPSSAAPKRASRCAFRNLDCARTTA